MARLELPTVKELEEALIYEPSSGFFFRRRFPDRRAESSTRGGYAQVFVKGKRYYASRVAWKMAHRQDPGEQDVDHIDNDRTNNSLSNLQLLPPRANTTKAKQRRKASKLPPGVFRSRHRYRAQAKVDGKVIHLGVFDDPEQAHQAYLEAI
ncbi:HNH endonuclease [Synechococcus phage S-CRES1]|nr:HNH endonuclease [Synechococcus phage S-CRES1]